VIEVDERICGPEPLAQFFARDDLPGLFKELGKDQEWLFLELDLVSLAAQFSCAQVNFEQSEPACAVL
jgi:hypothetical protein